VKRPLMGIVPGDLTAIPPYELQSELKLPNDVTEGVVIADEPSGSAARAGLEVYDVIVKLDNEEIANGMELRKFLFTKKKVGEELKVTFYRNGELKTATLTLTEAL
ncbi:MAG: PDZ domain-containing protein, partial [Bacilli bacterium]